MHTLVYSVSEKKKKKTRKTEKKKGKYEAKFEREIFLKAHPSLLVHKKRIIDDVSEIEKYGRVEKSRAGERSTLCR